MNKHLQSLLVLVAAGVAVWFVLGGKLPTIGIGNLPPFKTDKLAVLVVEESAAHREYTSDQLNVIAATDAKSVRETVRARGGEFQVIDLDTQDNLQNAPAWVVAAMAAKREKPPWVVAATPSSGFSIPLTTEADLLAKIGGLR